jgi:hypothetical protein
MLPWSIPLFEHAVADKARTTFYPVYSVVASNEVWAESQWLRLWQTPRDQRMFLTDLPAFDAGRDSRWPEGKDTGRPQRWTVAAAAERAELGKPVQRALIVGSNGWFVDPITQQQATGPDGRPVPRNPGNMELFEGAVSWLAGQDDLIAQSPSARATAMIREIPAAELTRLRAAMVLGMPLLVLLTGGVYRLTRR